MTAACLTLTVAVARPEDASRGVARLDPADIAILGAETGEVLRIAGPRATFARAQSSKPHLPRMTPVSSPAGNGGAGCLRTRPPFEGSAATGRSIFPLAGEFFETAGASMCKVRS